MTAARDALVRQRLAHAREGVACFYAVSALLARHGHAASKHSGVIALFNRHFVKPGTVSRELGRFYNDLFENRQQSDYDDYAEFDAARVRPWLAQATVFVAQLAELAERPTEEGSSA